MIYNVKDKWKFFNIDILEYIYDWSIKIKIIIGFYIVVDLKNMRNGLDSMEVALVDDNVYEALFMTKTDLERTGFEGK